MVESTFDYIIVGAGSAGCVLAERLSNDPTTSVLLIEAGPDDSNPFVHMPKGIGKLLQDPKHTWVFPTEADSATGLPAQYWVRGKVLGGSSSVNGMVYIRGQSQDYDHWSELGLTEWSWQAMAPYFKRMEDHALGGDEFRGTGGPLKVSQGSAPYPLADAVLEAARAMGIPVKKDLNGADQEGMAYLMATIRAGRRQSAAQAFLKPARKRRNLTVLTHTQVNRVLFAGTRADGVATERHGTCFEYRARREIMLCAGALQTPKLLQLSGIGPEKVLNAAGVGVLVDAPQVGRNLLEHRLLFVQHRLKLPGSVNNEFSGAALYRNALRYYLTRRGILATGSHDVGGFVRTRAQLDRPDVQLMMGPYSFDLSSPRGEFERQPGMHVFGYVLRPDSQGSLHIRSANPHEPPMIRPNYLSTDYDRRTSVDLVRLMRRWLSQDPLRPFLGEETTPGKDVETDAQILEKFAQSGQAGYHACGTCRMGVDAMAPLDAHLRVRGVQGLRVVDLSLFPSMISGNTNGPMMALAWRAADLMKGEVQ